MIVVLGAAHNRMANGIPGLLCKRHYPGAMDIAGVRQLASSWEHYIAVPDSPDERTMGKSSWHYIYEYIIFIAHFLNNDFVHVFVRISIDARRE